MAAGDFIAEDYEVQPLHRDHLAVDGVELLDLVLVYARKNVLAVALLEVLRVALAHLEVGGQHDLRRQKLTQLFLLLLVLQHCLQVVLAPVAAETDEGRTLVVVPLLLLLRNPSLLLHWGPLLERHLLGGHQVIAVRILHLHLLVLHHDGLLPAVAAQILAAFLRCQQRFFVALQHHPLGRTVMLPVVDQVRYLQLLWHLLQREVRPRFMVVLEVPLVVLHDVQYLREV